MVVLVDLLSLKLLFMVLFDSVQVTAVLDITVKWPTTPAWSVPSTLTSQTGGRLHAYSALLNA